MTKPPSVERVTSQKPMAAPPKAKTGNDGYDDLEIVQPPRGRFFRHDLGDKFPGPAREPLGHRRLAVSTQLVCLPRFQNP
jgi:hypothetical protein